MKYSHDQSSQCLLHKIYNIIEVHENYKPSQVYSYFMIATVFISLIPLFTRNEIDLFHIIESVTVTIFIGDYVLRWITCQYKIKKGMKSYLIYPFTFFAIIDLLSILPSFTGVNQGLKALKAMRAIKCLRIFKTLRYSKSFMLMVNVFKREQDALLTVALTAIAYIAITALIMFNVEISLETYFDAVYWATTALTTVGYGDIYPISELGKVISMISSLIGIAIVAIPSGIITAGYLEEVNNSNVES